MQYRFKKNGWACAPMTAQIYQDLKNNKPKMLNKIICSLSFVSLSFISNKYTTL